MVFCINPEQYEIFDKRIVKPVCIKKIENNVEVGSMVFQEMDTVSFQKNPLTYFPPNNVGLLLSVSKREAERAKQLFAETLDPKRVDHSFVKTQADKKAFLIGKSKAVADYVEAIQVALVFAYTALEAFANLSIPDDYEYRSKPNNKGVVELSDKKAIERWLTLKDKLAIILPKVYQTGDIMKERFWSHFIHLENYRNDIIHQKSITSTEFYKTYFRSDIFSICDSAELVLKFFFEHHAKKNKANPLWPWLIQKEREFPLTTEYSAENFEVVGNLYEGLKKKR